MLLGPGERPVGEDGEPLLGSTLHTTVDASRPPPLKTKAPAAVISLITALPDVPLSRNSSSVRSQRGQGAMA